jgi:predicted dehydrogenase
MEEFRLSYRYGDITTPAISSAEPLAIECSHFLDCVRNGHAPRSDGRVGRQVVRILEGAQRSLKHGGRAEDLSWSE